MATLSAALGRSAFCVTRFGLPHLGASGAQLASDLVCELSLTTADAIWHALSPLRLDPEDGRSYHATDVMPSDPEFSAGNTDLLFIWLRLGGERAALAGLTRSVQDAPFSESDRHRLESISGPASNMLTLQYRCDELQRREIVTRSIPALNGTYCVIDQDRQRIVWLNSTDDASHDEIWAHEEQIVGAVHDARRETDDEPVTSYPKLSFAQIVKIVDLGSQPAFGSERCSLVGLTVTPGIGGALSPREKQIANLLLAGYTTINVSAILSISENTIRTYVRRLYRKLNVVSRVDLARKCASSYDMGPTNYPVAALPSVTAQFR